MTETSFVVEEKPKLNKRDLQESVLYSLAKGASGTFFKLFQNLKIEGEENVPIRGKAILTTISKNAIRDMMLISQVTGRKIHFMVNHKMMRHKVAGPVLKSLGMFRSTMNKDDQEPIDKVFELLNEKHDLVAMTPEAKHDRDVQIKSMAGIIKFAIAASTPIIPVAVFTEKAKILNFIPTKGIKIKIGTPISVAKKLNRDKFRNERYALAEDIIDIIHALKEKEEE